MYLGLKHLHSFMAYSVLLILIVTIVNAFIRWTTNKNFTSQSRILVLGGLAFTHAQFVFGLVLYFLSPMGIANISNETMKTPLARLYAVEHPLMMVLAITLITIGYSKAKKAVDHQDKYKRIAIFYTLGFLFIFSRIPWKTWIG